MGRYEKNCNPVVEKIKSSLSTRVRKAIYLTGIIFFAYFCEFIWLLMDSNGQYKSDYAWEVLAHETLRQQYHAKPQIRVSYGKTSRSQCNFWNFEAVWGGCIAVKIGVDVRDYHPENLTIVEREVAHLAEKMRTPCHLIQTLGLANEIELGNEIGCKSKRKRFALYFWINEVTVVSESGPLERPNRWTANTVKHIYTTELIEGEL